MPVPQTSKTKAPRRLLRDVVYESMLNAILDGTLVPGERLVDDELTSWLGVSRTPVREAIGQLVHEGLVEMAANRYTRVASTSGKDFEEATEVLAGVHQVILARAGRAPVEVRDAVAATVRDLREGIEQKDIAAYRQLLDVVGALAGALGNTLLVSTELALRNRALFHLASPDPVIDWYAAGEVATALAPPSPTRG